MYVRIYHPISSLTFAVMKHCNPNSSLTCMVWPFGDDRGRYHLPFSDNLLIHASTLILRMLDLGTGCHAGWLPIKSGGRTGED